MSIYEQEGIVFDSNTGTALPNLRVEIWDVERVATASLGEATTDSEGRFSMSVDGDALEAILEFVPEGLFFKVFDDTNLVGTTEGVTIWPLIHSVTSSQIFVNLPVAGLVDGLVADAAGGPIADADVSVYNRRTESTGVVDTLLGEAASNPDGRFRIRYNVTDGRPVNLVIRAHDGAGNLLAESEEIARAAATVQVDLTVGGASWEGPSEIDRVKTALSRELGASSATLAGMPAAAVTTLARTVNTDERQVSDLAAAAGLEQSTGVAQEVFYGMARHGLPADMHVLLSAGADTRMQAVNAAVARRTVSPFADINTDMDQLSAALVSYALEETSVPGRPALKDVVATSLVTDTNLHQSFVQVLVERTGTDAEFWDTVSAHSTLGAHADEFKLSFQLAGVLQGFVELQQEIGDQRATANFGGYETLRDIAGIDRNGWISHIQSTGSPIPFPPHVPGETEQERLDHFVDAVMAVLDAAFPSDALRRDLNNSPALSAAGNTFLANNTELDLLLGDIDAFVVEQGATAFTGIADPADQAKAVAEAKTVQRIARCTSKPAWTKALLEAGYVSAMQISLTSTEMLIAQMSGSLGGDDNVKAVRAAAASQAATAQATAMVVKEMNDITPMVMKSTDAPNSASANIATLFGSTSYCSCNHCSSVYSPAAYFVDLLHMLDQGDIEAASNPLNVLLRRRPDLAQLSLSCENTNTPIPYVDLVNEILETYIDVAYVPPLGDPTLTLPTGDTGASTAEELRAAPQRVLNSAYAELQTNAVYPISLPFARPLEVSRAYLAHLGSSRLEVMRQFAANGTPAQSAITYEQLGLSAEQGTIVAGLPFGNPATPTYAYFGFEAADVTTWVDTLASVPVLLNRLGVSFDELSELMKTRFVENGDTVTFATTANNCDINEMTLTPATEARFDRMHRFVRLARALNWSSADLDIALASLGAADIGPTELAEVAAIEQIRVELGLPVEVLCASWANLDTYGDSSLYNKLFINRSVLPTAEDGDFAIDSITGDLANVGTLTLDSRAAAVAAAVGLRGQELALLREALPLGQTNGMDDLSLANLSALYRHAMMARALKLDVEELLALISMAGATRDPFVPVDPAPAVAFIELARKIEGSAFDMGTLSYVYRHRPVRGRNPEPTSAHIDASLAAVQAALVNVDQELEALAAPDEAAFLAYVTQIVGDAEVAQLLLDALDLSTTQTQTEREDLYAVELPMLANGYYSALFAPAPAPSNGEEHDNHRAMARELVMGQLLSVTRPHKEVARVLAPELSVSPEMAAQLLGTHLQAVDTQGASLHSELIGLADPTELPKNYRASFVRAFKAAIMVSRLGLSVDDAAVMLARYDDTNSAPINMTELPVAEPADAAAVAAGFADWPEWHAWVSFAAQLRTGAGALSEIVNAVDINATDVVAAVPLIAQATGWDEQDVSVLTGANGFNFAGADLRDGAQLMRLAEAIRLSRQLGVSAELPLSWAQAAPTAAQADEVVSAVRTHYSQARWLEVSQGLNDPLRERQRDALIAYLVPRLSAEGVASVNDLYTHFLIDVEMSACALTSRVKQAISSVQLFVQRVLLNLERAVGPGEDPNDDVPPTSVNAEQWKWRKNYRVWEANRKVFLYPENWIEPELRLDKSPFFKELEAELRQGELTEETIETALSNYLHKLDEVSRLVPVAHEWEFHPDNGNKEKLHIVGRSAGAPYQYYYRTMTVQREWTAWERIDLDIESEQMVLMFVDGRLNLCWPTFVGGSEGSENDIKEYWDIRLHMSERRGGGWSEPKVSISPVRTPAATVLSARNQYFLRVDADQVVVGDVGRFFVRCGQLESSNSIDSVISPATPAFGLTPEYQRYVAPKGQVVALFMDPLLILGSLSEASGVSLLNGDDARPPQGVFFFTHGDARFRVTPSFHTQAASVYEGSAPASHPKSQGKGIRDALATGNMHHSTDSPSEPTAPGWQGLMKVESQFYFHSFYQPFLCDFAAGLHRGGSAALLSLANQQLSLDGSGPAGVYHFQTTFSPVAGVVKTPYPATDVTFRNDDAMALYNWELFFHVPMLIATRLNQEQRHEEAQRWFHFLFDPTTTDAAASPKRFWRCLPLRNNNVVTSANDMMNALASPEDHPEIFAALQTQLASWMRHPFEPHRIAQLRTAAYQKTVVMKYIDNLLDWGDKLFRRDTLEALNEATQLYVLAANILGERPIMVPPLAEPVATSYAQLRPDLSAAGGAFPNALVAIENMAIAPIYSLESSDVANNGSVGMAAFCTPHNNELLGYWDRVSDRLFKLRHCLDIRGERRALPLFEPPIDPALLVRARAAGVDFGSILDDLYAAPTPYRFQVLLAKAQQLVGETRGFGGALLAALEKKDAEALAGLRNTQEVSVLEAIRSIKKMAIEEAKLSQQSLTKAREHAEARLLFYRERSENGVHTIAEEDEQLTMMDVAQGLQTAAQGVDTIAKAITMFIPQIGFQTSPPGANTNWGGLHLMNGAAAASQAIQLASGLASYRSSRAATIAGRKRRHDDWLLQANQAEKEIQRIDKDLLAAEVREQIARADLNTHEMQIKNAKDVQVYLRSKRTNEELYDWMINKLREVYFQVYKLAYDMAKRAERAYRYELGIEDSNIIQFGYWDSLKQGLLAGEQLALDLQRLDVAHTIEDRREHELSKSISLARLDPAALLKLRSSTNGIAEIELPEWLFDLDYTGHYMRRIKAVRITLPAVAGPHTSVNCRLTQLSSRIRQDASAAGDYTYTDVNDLRFSHRFGPTESICTSHGQNDSGVFELSFQDPRYLPFEGSGVISKWRIELAPDANAFDRSTLTDVVLHISYTARDGGDSLKAAAKTALGQAPAEAYGVERIFSMKHEFPNAWYAFMNELEEVVDPTTSAITFDQVLTISLAGKLPYLLGSGAPGVDQIYLAAKWSDASSSLDLPIVLTPAAFTNPLGMIVAAAPVVTLAQREPSEEVFEPLAVDNAEAADWELRIVQAALDQAVSESDPLAAVIETYNGGKRIVPDSLDDVYLVVRAARGISKSGDSA